MFEMWEAVGYLGCGMFKILDFQEAGCSKCGMFRMWVFRRWVIRDV